MPLLERYPDLYFFLSYTPHEPYTFFLNQSGEKNAYRRKNGEEEVLHTRGNIAEETKEWISSFALEKIEILYCYGIGLGYCYPLLKEWLKQESGKRLVFLEDDLGALATFLQTEISEEILADPQVVLRYVQDWASELETLAQTFPYTHVETTALPSYAKREKQKISKMRLQLLRKSSSYHALFSEALFSPKLLENLAINLRRLPSSFYANGMRGRYKDLPAIICGAGPSLKTAIPRLKSLENRALIFAGGSAIAALSNQGVLPHFCMALDPNPEEMERLQAASTFELPLLFASRLNPDTFLTQNGPTGYLKSDTGGVFETWIEEKLSILGEAVGPDLGGEAFSVTTLAVAFAYLLGCNPIVLAGVDLAYTGMQRYAEGVMAQNTLSIKTLKTDKRATDRLLRRKGRQGKMVYTLVKWVMESSALSAYAKAHPDCKFLSATEGGIGFSDIEFMSLDEIVQRHCTQAYDLRAKIHSDIQTLKMGYITLGQIDSLYAELRLSLKWMLNLCEEILQELPRPSAKKIVLEMDLQEEMAYKPLLEIPLLALDRLLERYAHASSFDRDKIKWQRVKQIIEEQLKVLNNE